MIVDSNLIILAARKEHEFLLDWLESGDHRISAISYVEIFGYHQMSPEEQEALEVIFINLPVVQISNAILDRAVEQRRRKRMGLGDCLVAATALELNVDLATANTRDFKNIPGLRIFNPIQPHTGDE